MTPLFPATIVIAADLDPRVPMIMIDAGFIYQTILNLCINARDAMPDGGKILLQTRITLGGALRQRFPEARAEQYVYISVADTGVGMEADVRSRVFESYFTTKTAQAKAPVSDFQSFTISSVNMRASSRSPVNPAAVRRFIFICRFQETKQRQTL